MGTAHTQRSASGFHFWFVFWRLRAFRLVFLSFSQQPLVKLFFQKHLVVIHIMKPQRLRNMNTLLFQTSSCFKQSISGRSDIASIHQVLGAILWHKLPRSGKKDIANPFQTRTPGNWMVDGELVMVMDSDGLCIIKDRLKPQVVKYVLNQSYWPPDLRGMNTFRDATYEKLELNLLNFKRVHRQSTEMEMSEMHLYPLKVSGTRLGTPSHGGRLKCDFWSTWPDCGRWVSDVGIVWGWPWGDFRW